jgi:hypothetical protein
MRPCYSALKITGRPWPTGPTTRHGSATARGANSCWHDATRPCPTTRARLGVRILERTATSGLRRRALRPPLVCSFSVPFPGLALVCLSEGKQGKRTSLSPNGRPLLGWAIIARLLVSRRWKLRYVLAIIGPKELKQKTKPKAQRRP